MLSRDDIGRLLEYTVWANHRILRAAATLNTANFRRDLGSSHGGVRGTLVHILGAEWIWLERWKGISPDKGIDEGEFTDVVALRDRWTVLEEHRAAWFAALKEPALAKEVRFRTLDGRQFEAPLWQLVQHTTNHSTYHRGQVMTLLRILGAKTVATDMLLWDRDRERRESRARARS
jgi:uncharacterized damage-inducible protein DinB